ncbi:MAG TPA: transcription antitermination protein NusB [Crocinitomix sp.]|nr:transcription antitermination protein NusB [Crocinitomix sp.]
MLNRRHLRTKVLQILYAFFQSEDAELHQFEKQLFKSVDKMYDLYLYFLLIFGELHTFSENRIEERKARKFPTEDDLNPNTKFVDNKIINLFLINQSLKNESEIRKINWTTAEKNDLIKKLFLTIVDSEIYQTYMDDEDNSFERDKQFVIDIFKTEIANFSLLHDFFENDNIYWIDDIDLVCSMVLKTIRNFNEDDDHLTSILPLYKDEADEKDFIKTLLRKTIANDNENSALIDKLTNNWDFDRIAKMDVILLKMALTELVEFPSIPTKVTLNEYIEISKFYSSPQSKVFINGVLDKAIVTLTNEGKIKKVGRGLLK